METDQPSLWILRNWECTVRARLGFQSHPWNWYTKNVPIKAPRDGAVHAHATCGRYRQTCKMSRTLVGYKIVDHSDVVGASPIGAAQTTSSFSTWQLSSKDWTKAAAGREEKHLSLGFGATYIRGLTLYVIFIITMCHATSTCIRVYNLLYFVEILSSRNLPERDFQDYFCIHQ